MLFGMRRNKSVDPQQQLYSLFSNSMTTTRRTFEHFLASRRYPSSRGLAAISLNDLSHRRFNLILMGARETQRKESERMSERARVVSFPVCGTYQRDRLSGVGVSPHCALGLFAGGSPKSQETSSFNKFSQSYAGSCD